MRVAPRIVTLLASTARLAVEAFSFLAFPLRIADQEHRHGWLRIAIHGDGRQVSLNYVFLALGSFSWRPKLSFRHDRGSL